MAEEKSPAWKFGTEAVPLYPGSVVPLKNYFFFRFTEEAPLFVVPLQILSRHRGAVLLRGKEDTALKYSVVGSGVKLYSVGPARWR